MTQEFSPTQSVRFLDLVLEPDTCHDSLISAARHETLAHGTIEHLIEILPRAVTQLAEVGDEYGALALEELYDELLRQHTAV